MKNNNMLVPDIMMTLFFTYFENCVRTGSIKFIFAILPIPYSSSSSSFPIGCVACGRFPIPSLIGLSSSVISLAVAFCVSVIGLKIFERSDCNCCYPVLSLRKLPRIFFLSSKNSFTIKSLLTGSLIFKNDISFLLRTIIF